MEYLPKNSALHLAVNVNDMDKVDELLMQGCSVNRINSHGDTPLHLAVKYNNINAAKKILINKADVNLQNYKGKSALFFAHDLLMIDLLLDWKSNLNIQDYNRDTPLQYAVTHDNFTLFQRLLDSGANVSLFNDDGNTALHSAAGGSYLNIKIIEKLLNKGAKMNVKNFHGCTALHLAKCSRVTSFLIDKGAQINVKNNDKEIPLHFAVKLGYISVIKVLLERGSDVNSQNKEGESALHLAVTSNNHTAVNMLLANGADINKQTLRDLKTPLHYAVLAENILMVRRLVLKKADVNIKDVKGDTALHSCKRHKNTIIIDFLLDNGADLETRNNQGKTLWFYLIDLSNNNLLRAMLKYEIPINNQIFNGNTLLHEVKENTDFWFLQEMVESRISVNKKNREGNTPLHFAAKSGNSLLVSTLIGKGAKINTQNNNGDTPLHFTSKFEIGLKLIDAGAKSDIPNWEGDTPLHKAVTCWWQSETELFNTACYKMCQGDIDRTNVDGNTALHYAVKYNKIAWVTRLIEHGAAVDVKNNKKQTILHFARSEVKTIITRQVIKLETIGLPVDLMIPLEDEDSLRMKNVLVKECLDEIEILNERIVEGHPLSIVISKRDDPCYLLNNELCNGLFSLMESLDFHRDFPLYCHILRNTFEKTNLGFHLSASTFQ